MIKTIFIFKSIVYLKTEIMKYLALIICVLFSTISQAQDDSIFELEANQSMSITGQGPGQDAAINPFQGEYSLAVVENLGTSTFDIRTKDEKDKVSIVTIDPKKTKIISLSPETILYLDSKDASKAKVTFQRMQ